jgi:hypothetical protein
VEKDEGEEDEEEEEEEEDEEVGEREGKRVGEKEVDEIGGDREWVEDDEVIRRDFGFSCCFEGFCSARYEDALWSAR